LFWNILRLRFFVLFLTNTNKQRPYEKEVERRSDAFQLKEALTVTIINEGEGYNTMPMKYFVTVCTFDCRLGIPLGLCKMSCVSSCDL